MAWNDSTTPLDIIPGETHLRPITLMVDPNGGSVQVQLRDSTGTWITPTAPEYTITQAGPVRIVRANTPALRIIATAGARFEVTQD